MCDSNNWYNPVGGVMSDDDQSGFSKLQAVFDPFMYNARTKTGFGRSIDPLNRTPGDPTTASGMRARIAREQWADYKQRFQPIENTLLYDASNPKQYADKNRGLALDRVNKVYSQGVPQTERRLESYGLEITPEMQNRIAKRLNYDKGLSQVQAANMSDRLSKDQLQAVVGGGLFVGNRAVQNTKQVG